MIKVIGAGLFRTGTMSLKQALEDLGFSQCYHFIEVLKNPGHLAMWEAAANGETIDWDKLFEGYQATTDAPAYHYYRELMDLYPESKVILTVRDPQSWYKSSYTTLYTQNRPLLHRKILFSIFGIFKPDLKGTLRAWELTEKMEWQGHFQSKFADKEFSIQLFNQHIENVKEAVPSDRLLVYNLKEGWEPLCDFLNVPIPDHPLPHLNDTAAFMNYRKRLFW
ncbi:MAG: sulfotransferase family protein [Chloroflexota bacterium]